MRRLVFLAALAVVFAFPAGGAASVSYSEQFKGVEVPPVTSTLGTFTGVASGGLAGGWYAQISHQQLLIAPGATVPIYGGTFILYALSGQTLSGTVEGGSVTVVNPGYSCHNQTFAVNASLSDGSFSGLLTHYRFSFFGSCITYAASIVGNGTLQG